MVMKKIIIFCLLTVSYLNLLAQTNEERKLSAFDKIVISSDIKVYLTKGTEEKVKVKVSGIDLSEIQTKISGKTLEIDFSRGVHMDAVAELYVTFKEIRNITVGAAGKLSIDSPLVGDKVVFEVNTKGEIDVEIKLNTVDIIASQGGTIRISGTTGSIDAKVSTRGIISATELISDNTYIQVGSAGIAKIYAKNILDANVSLGGTLTYSGHPKDKNIKTSLGATINEIE
jgi:hypothetical protein